MKSPAPSNKLETANRETLSPLFGVDHIAIDDVFQASTLDVNEEGATVAVVSEAVAGLGMSMQPLVVTFDHPFAFVIRDRDGRNCRWHDR